MIKKVIAENRRRRDKSLDLARAAVMYGYIFGSYVILGLHEMNGEDVRVAAGVVYTSYAALILLSAMLDANTTYSNIIRSFTSFVALLITLVLAMPARMLLYGVVGYKEYAIHEIKRVVKMEMTRWEERR